jgi:hypothetical protein
MDCAATLFASFFIMRKWVLIFLAVLPATTLAFTPTKTRSPDEFSPQVRKFIDVSWDKLHAKDFSEKKLVYEYNSAQCSIFRDYIGTVLRRLIQESKLEDFTQDLYLLVECYNKNNFPLGAVLVSRTLIIQAGYMGGLTTEDELAALLAHELSHHTLRHDDIVEPSREKLPHRIHDPFESFVQSAPLTPEEIEFRNMKRVNEDEADQNSVLILANAGYSYVGAIDLLKLVYDIPGVDMQYSSLDGRQAIIIREARRLGLSPTEQKPFPEVIQNAVTAYFEKDRSDLKKIVRGSRRFKVSSLAKP